MTHETPEQLGRYLAAEIAEGIRAAASEDRNYLLGCPGGRSPLTTYTALTALVAATSLDLSHVVIVMMDDYVLPTSDGFRPVPSDVHYSVARFARDVIVNPLNAAAPPGAGIRPEHLWFPDPSAPSVYDETIAEAGGVDLFILASGDSDGHVAFNPPGSRADSRTRIIELAETTRTDNLGTFPDFASLDEVPAHGISVGIATIRELSKRVVLVAPGAGKRMAVDRILAADHYDPTWPATVVCDCADPWLYTDLAGRAGSPGS